MAETIQRPTDAQAPPSPARPLGELKLHPFKSTVFGNKRMLRVWLPPGYGDRLSRKRLYPVLYLNDGQNLFDPATAFGGVEWQVDETAERLIQERRIEPLIIVGIDNAKVANSDDLFRVLDKYQIGQTVQVQIWRDGKRVSVPVRLMESPDSRR